MVFEPDVEDDVVTRSTRRVAVAYPDAFRGLRDLTLLETGAASGTLDGYSRAVPTVAGELRGPGAVWLLHRWDVPDALLDRDTGVLVAAGLQVTGRWEGPRTTVLRYQKVPIVDAVATGCATLTP